jgi:hypothetical protein
MWKLSIKNIVYLLVISLSLTFQALIDTTYKSSGTYSIKLKRQKHLNTK